MMPETGLDDLFAEARAARPVPSEALMARVLADALAEQPKAVVPAVAVLPAGRAQTGLWARIVWAFGGVGALAGMGTAAVAGLFIGFVQPVGLAGIEDAMLGTPLETVELIPSMDALLDGN
jgi:hypothetical protein